MPKKNIVDQKDLDAFYEAVKGTKPLKVEKKVLRPATHSPSKKYPVRIQQPNEPEESFYFSDADKLESIEGDAFMVHKHLSISNKILRKLRKGQYNVEITLDLHGLSVEKARIALDNFLQHCLHHGIRIALVIHGKGSHSQMPVLKNKLNHWLRETEWILAFCSAIPRDGGNGATYVLLKRLMT